MASRSQIPRENTDQPQYNVDMRTKKLHKMAKRAYTWRARVWSQEALRIEEINKQLAEMGQPPVDPIDFDPYDEESYEEWARAEVPPK